ncbi:nuclear transport factor 2 family protein [Roseateles cellulosilyticus]|uniref:Nuclear transport factor 2 family protein n=1 Tax=Pelomonas cellulosilytica TaxID=2906762 RepID=A0ABS8XNK3_9BURK|nr:nuclear transport factor 2 family protein [Pelomonas sp. P8]MCE4554342.1 nuclear transport factor 2 family protein [Pelomonas sp. P8]
MFDPTPASATAPTVARVVSLVRSIPLSVDLGRYELAEAAFAPRVRIDYSSLWGGQAQDMAAADLLAAWRGLVPGFDATLHELGPVQVSLNGDSAQATADVVASHWLEGQLWRLVGRYEWPLRRGTDGWRVTGMTFQCLQEQGDRGLCERAQARVAARV